MKNALLWILCLYTCVPAICQSASSSQLSAKQVLQQTIAAMSLGSNTSSMRDFSLTGSMQFPGSEGIAPAKVLSRGDDMRLDITMPNGGTHSVAFLRGSGRMRNEMGKEMPLSSSSRAGTEIAFLPMPGVLLDFAGSAGEATFAGMRLSTAVLLIT